MPAKVLRNAKEVKGAISIEISGKTAKVETEIGSELDGLLYYNATRSGDPRFCFEKDGHVSTPHRFRVGMPNNGVYELSAETEIRF